MIYSFYLGRKKKKSFVSHTVVVTDSDVRRASKVEDAAKGRFSLLQLLLQASGAAETKKYLFKNAVFKNDKALN